MTRFLLVCLGGAVGTGARYALGGFLLRSLGPSFPYGTLAVNLIGSFLLAVIMQIGLDTEVLSSTARITLAVGVMGGFTTYSTFSYETVEFFRRGEAGLATLNVAITVLGCALACLLGTWAAKSIS